MNKNRKGQQLVEFALVLPILLTILFSIIEIGFTLNARIALAEAVRYSVNRANQLVGNTQADIKSSLETSIKTYLSIHNLPNSDSVTVDIYEPTAGNGEETALVKVNYKYHPFFNLIDFFGQNVVPTEFNFSSYQVINEALLKSNTYNSTFSSSDLDSLSKDSSVVKDQIIDGLDFRPHVAFLIGFDTTSGGSGYDYARLFNWWGQDLLPSNLALNMQTGHLEVKSPYYNSGNWFDTKVPYTWVLTSLGFTEAIYSRIDSDSAFTSYKLDLADSSSVLNLNIPLYGQTGCSLCGNGGSDLFLGDMSSNLIDNINKRAFNLFLDNSQSPFGSFDKIKSLSGATNLGIMNNYTFNKDNNYVLRLFVPSSTKPDDVYSGYKFDFNLTSGEYSALASSNTDIISCYIDSDGDGIPDAWDNNPEYPDVDGNGVYDGEQSSISAVIIDPALPNEIDTSQPGVTTSDVATKLVAAPYKMDGSINDSYKSNSALKSYTPKVFSVNTLKYTSGSYVALYFLKSGTIYTRKVTYLSSLADKANFINGTNSGSTIDLNKSAELNILESGAFNTTGKVSH